MKIGFIGIGKLGKDAAEVMSYNHDVIGYDIQKIDTDKFDTVDSIENVCKDI
jgi:6-phosphogluconate dehydrogenase (decarboxylating)